MKTVRSFTKDVGKVLRGALHELETGDNPQSGMSTRRPFAFFQCGCHREVVAGPHEAGSEVLIYTADLRARIES